MSEWNAQSTDWGTGLYAGGLLNAFERCEDALHGREAPLPEGLNPSRETVEVEVSVPGSFGTGEASLEVVAPGPSTRGARSRRPMRCAPGVPM